MKLRSYKKYIPMVATTIGAIISAVVLVRDQHDDFEFEDLTFRVRKGTSAKMASGNLMRYNGEKGDYEFMILNKKQGTLFAPGVKNPEIRDYDIVGEK